MTEETDLERRLRAHMEAGWNAAPAPPRWETQIMHAVRTTPSQAPRQPVRQLALAGVVIVSTATVAGATVWLRSLCVNRQVTNSTASTPVVTPSPSGFPTVPSIVGKIMRVSASGTASTVGTLEISGTQPHRLPAEAIITITSQTEIRLQGSTARKSFADLSTGQEVEVWFVGDVLQSYPEQARAGALTILTPRGP